MALKLHVHSLNNNLAKTSHQPLSPKLTTPLCVLFPPPLHHITVIVYECALKIDVVLGSLECCIEISIKVSKPRLAALDIPTSLWDRSTGSDVCA